MARPPAVGSADLEVAAPAELPGAASQGVLARVLFLGLSVAALGVVAATFSGPGRTPTSFALPLMMLVPLVVSVVTGRGRRRETEIDGHRADYLGYLDRLRCCVTETAAAQRSALNLRHPDPDTLWTLVGGPRMWEREPGAPDFCVVRVGVGTRPLATRMVAPPLRTEARWDPLTVTALRRFLRAHSTVAGVPITICLRPGTTVTVEGDVTDARALLNAMICQLAVLHAPDQLLIVGVIAEPNRAHWDWLKWLPHNQHPSDRDAVGAARMVYPNVAAAQSALTALAARVVLLVDDDARVAPAIPGAIVLEVGGGEAGMPVTIGHIDEADTWVHPDRLEPVEAVVCARRLAAHRAGDGAAARGRSGWLDLIDIDDAGTFDPTTLWHSRIHRNRLCAPLGTTSDGAAVELDIREPAEGGMGPHGLCVGATGSGKSELLRTIALGMLALNPPNVLNLLLIDFKGGATFLDFARAPHVAAVITNLADEAPLVARMREALAGEINRRQRLLRAAGNMVSVVAYEDARRSGAPLTALPTLFIIVDEFSELLSQHPDFAEMFVMIGRVGRSLGMHLLLASQRLDEGRLRGLEAHLSYRICLKMLSPSESRTALGTVDAYELPNTPGVGILRGGSGELIEFQTAYVSGPLPPTGVTAAPSEVSVRVFSTHVTGSIISAAADESTAADHTLLRAVLDRLSGQRPLAHRVWLPPLELAPTLGAVLREAGSARTHLAVPIGVVDRPLEQCRTPLMLDLSGAAGNVAIVGGPRSGKSTALCTLIMALAATHDASCVQFYCLDFGGGSLASVAALPHVGTAADRTEPRLAVRMIAELESVLRSRETAGADPVPHIFLVVDGWARLRHEFEALEESVTALAAQGLSFGVHVALSASRWSDIRPALKDQIGTRIELRLGDPAESELDRRQAREVPHDRPGRGLSREGLHMIIAQPRLEGIELRRGDVVAPPIPLLPHRVDHQTLVRVAGERLGAHVLLGLDERQLKPVALDFDRDPHWMIVGDNECGKTATLRALCREVVRTAATAAQLVLIDYRRTLLGVVESEHLRGYAMSPAALNALLPDLLDVLRRRMPPADATQAQLRDRSWWSGPDIYVVVDDYDLVATAAGNPLAPLLEYLPYARDLGLHLIVARRSGGLARALFEPVLAALRDLGCMALMMSARPEEGATFGSVRPRLLPPGRGVLVTRDDEGQLVQVAWSPPPP
ncbi:MAG: type VII secretion protein EccCa [Mycobacterium sp.]|uniref:type VII secretion protein EccCa n=1 Tax=Mycobacterium sp. TaxID=1785 RepID=UPI001EC37E74|nr:type VII secretion protein EccCa [Mycobacterium sp.]MBW0017221.1 type VII secretion protein EccCa [Mycobacterium sp.]